MKKDQHKAFDQEILNQLKFGLARDKVTASKRDWWIATSKAVQNVVIERMIKTLTTHTEGNVRRVFPRLDNLLKQKGH